MGSYPHRGLVHQQQCIAKNMRAEVPGQLSDEGGGRREGQRGRAPSRHPRPLHADKGGHVGPLSLVVRGPREPSPSPSPPSTPLSCPLRTLRLSLSLPFGPLLCLWLLLLRPCSEPRRVPSRDVLACMPLPCGLVRARRRTVGLPTCSLLART